MSRKYFLKMVGAADWPLSDRWIEDRPDLLSRIRTPNQPSAIGRGDYLVYYSAVTQKLFAIVRSVGDGSDAPMEGGAGEERWPYVLRVQALIAVPQLALAPSWDVLDLPSGTVQQKSYVQITPSKYAIAHAAITARTALPE